MATDEKNIANHISNMDAILRLKNTYNLIEEKQLNYKHKRGEGKLITKWSSVK